MDTPGREYPSPPDGARETPPASSQAAPFAELAAARAAPWREDDGTCFGSQGPYRQAAAKPGGRQDPHHLNARDALGGCRGAEGVEHGGQGGGNLFRSLILDLAALHHPHQLTIA